MKIFAIELSSKYGSIALIENGQILAEKSWLENFKNRQQLFDSLAELQHEQHLDWNSIDSFAVGRGPGAFSGMRIAFSVINSLAQAGRKPIHALSSGHALAAQTTLETTATHIAIVGDARRQQIWAGTFLNGEPENPFELMAYEELNTFLPENTLIASPDQDRLKTLLQSFNHINTPTHPTAGMLGKLVETRIKKNIPSEEPEPLYMHPPVFIEPRFSV